MVCFTAFPHDSQKIKEIIYKHWHVLNCNPVCFPVFFSFFFQSLWLFTYHSDRNIRHFLIRADMFIAIKMMGNFFHVKVVLHVRMKVERQIHLSVLHWVVFIIIYNLKFIYFIFFPSILLNDLTWWSHILKLKNVWVWPS